MAARPDRPTNGADPARARTGPDWPESSGGVKPRLRGWLHAGMAPLALAAGIVLDLPGADRRRRASAARSSWWPPCCCSAPAAIYHRFAWGPRGEAVLRRMDHANIYVFIAATYTPLALLLLPGSSRVVLLTLIWSAALGGLLFRLFWLSAPRWLYTALYLVMGWAAVGWLGQFYAAGGLAVLVLILAGGAAATPSGAVVYGLKRPDPSPALVRLPRDLPRLHDRRLRLPLHRDLADHLRRLAEVRRLRAVRRAGPGRTGQRQLLPQARRRDRQPADEVPADVRGRPAVEHRPVREQRERPAGPGSPATTTDPAGRQPVGRPDQLVRSGAGRSPTTATCTGVRDAVRLIASASSQPANRGACRASAPALSRPPARRVRRSASSPVSSAISRQRPDGGAEAGRGRVVGRDPAAGCRAARRRRRCRRTRRAPSSKLRRGSPPSRCPGAVEPVRRRRAPQPSRTHACGQRRVVLEDPRRLPGHAVAGGPAQPAVPSQCGRQIELGRLGGRRQPVRSIEDHGRLDQRVDQPAVPGRDHLVVAAGPGPPRPRGPQPARGRRPAGPGPGRRAAGGWTPRARTFPAGVTRERLGGPGAVLLAQRGDQLGRGPDVERALVQVARGVERVRVQAGREGALRSVRSSRSSQPTVSSTTRSRQRRARSRRHQWA